MPDHIAAHLSTRPRTRSAIGAALVGAALLVAGPLAAAAAGGHDELLALFADYRDWQAAGDPTATPDVSAAALAARHAGLDALMRRLGALEPRGWNVPEQVDYLAVRAELDQKDFIRHVTRPWARDPVWYVAPLLDIAFTGLPVAGDDLARLEQRLAAVPQRLAAARGNLTEVAADYADLAIRSLTQSDGVENGYPYRADPPDGIVGWFEDLRERAADVQPALLHDIDDALASLESFHDWLVANRAEMTAPNGVGRPALDWFLRYGLLLPYSSEEMVVLAQRELDRLWSFYALEQHRNRDLPPLELATSREDYQDRLATTDRHLRDWLRAEGFVTIPPYVPEDWREMGYNVPWIVRATPPNFWEQVQFRDPAPDHLHAVIPGHRFDAMLSARIPHPIRSAVNFGARWQGWAVYLEEAALQAGALEERPRTRELIYVFGIWRAARSLGDIYNQWNRMTAGETASYWMEVTPLLDPDVARKYAYLRPAPGHGLEYTIGNIQVFELLATEKRRLGEDFVLGEFHDEFLSKGRIPIELIRYEMTGDDRFVKTLWERPSLRSVLSPPRAAAGGISRD